MSDKSNFYFEQLVEESDLDQIYTDMEAADRNILTDQGYYGVYDGLAVVEHAPTPDLTVDVEAGVAYDQEGRRCYIAADQTLDISLDSNGSATAVANPGNSKWVSVFIQYATIQSDIRVDGNGASIFYRETESYELVVVQGAEAVAPTRPALLADAVLIADILLTEGQTQIFDADIESADTTTKPDSRFEYAFNLTASSPATVRTGGIPDALQATLTQVNNHIAEVANAHDADAIAFSGAAAVPSGATPALAGLQASTELQGALEGLALDLSDASSAANSGADRIGYYDGVAGVETTVQDAIDALADLHDGHLGPRVDEVAVTALNTVAVHEYTLPADCVFLIKSWGVMVTSDASEFANFQLIQGGTRAGGVTTITTAVVYTYEDGGSVDPIGSVVVDDTAAGAQIEVVGGDFTAGTATALVHSEILIL